MTFFDDHVAARYDDPSDPANDPAAIEPVVGLLADLAGGGPVLEFAVGTGRIALPLSERGVEVSGIEISQPMLDQLAAKPGSDRLAVVQGDMAITRVEGTFSLVYLVYNTISNLLTQDEQVECFRNAAAHLEPGGRFVIEVGVPRLQRLGVGETLLPFDVSPHHIGIDEFDVVRQLQTSHHYWIRDGEIEMFDSVHRFAWPSEYDLMARLAGLSLEQRWADWQRAPFTAESTAHISLWTKPG